MAAEPSTSSVPNRTPGRRISISLDVSGRQLEVDTGELNAVAKLLSTDRLLEQKARAVERRCDERRRRRRQMDKVAKRNDKIHEMFETFDIDGDGTIDEIEFSEVVRFLRIPIETDNITRTFMTIDSDGTGSISLQEFQNWYNTDGKALIKRNGLERFRMNMQNLSQASRKARYMTIAKYEILRENFVRHREAKREQEQAAREAAEAKLAELSDEELEFDAAAALNDEDLLDGHDDDDVDGDAVHGDSNGGDLEVAAEELLDAADDATDSNLIAGSQDNAPQPIWRRHAANVLFADDVRHILSRVNSVEYSCLALNVCDNTTDDGTVGNAAHQLPFGLHIAFKTVQSDEASSLAALAEFCELKAERDEPPRPLIVLFKSSLGFCDGIFDEEGNDLIPSTSAPSASRSTVRSGDAEGLGGDYVCWRLLCHVPASLPNEDLAVFLRSYHLLMGDSSVRHFFDRSGRAVPFVRDFATLATKGAFTGLRGAPRNGGDAGAALRELRVGMLLRSDSFASGGAELFGRERELLRLHQLLSLPPDADKAEAGVVVVLGMSGVGKKFLAATYARLASQRFPMGVFNLCLADAFQLQLSANCAVKSCRQLSPATDSTQHAFRVSDFSYNAFSHAEQHLLRYLHSTVGWALLVHGVRSAAQLKKFLGERRLLQRTRDRCGCIIAVSDTPADEFTTLDVTEDASGLGSFANVLHLSTFSRQEGSIFLLSNGYALSSPTTGSDSGAVVGDTSPTPSDEESGFAALARDQAVIAGNSAKAIVKLTRCNPCALQLCLDGVCQVLRKQQQQQYVPPVVDSDEDDDLDEPEKPPEPLINLDNAVATAFQQYVERLKSDGEAVKQPKNGAAIEIVKALTTNIALLRERFPKLWKQASLALQLCTCVHHSHVSLHLISQFFVAAAEASSSTAPSAKSTARATAKAEAQAVRVCSLLEATGFVSTRLAHDPSPLLNRRTQPGSASSNLSVEGTALFWNAAVHKALYNAVEAKTKLVTTISEIVFTGLSESDFAFNRTRDAISPAKCLSSLAQEDRHPSTGVAIAQSAAAAHLHILLTRHRVSKIQIKRCLTDYMPWFFALAMFAVDANDDESSKDYFDRILHWVGHTSDKQTKKEASAGMIPKVVARHRRIAAIALRQTIRSFVAHRQFEDALEQCRGLNSLLDNGMSSLRQGKAARSRTEVAAYRIDPQLGSLRLAAALLEGDVHWRMRSWDACLDVYTAVLQKYDAAESGGSTNSVDATLGVIPDLVAARITCRMGYIKLHRVFRRSSSVPAGNQMLNEGDPNSQKRRDVEDAAELVQKSLSLQQVVYGGAVSRFETGFALHTLGNALALLLPSPVKSFSIIEQALAMYQRLLTVLRQKPPTDKDKTAAAAEVVATQPKDLRDTPGMPGSDWTIAELVVEIGHIYYDLGVHILGGKSVVEPAEAQDSTSDSISVNNDAHNPHTSGVAALSYFRTCLEHFLLVKNDPSVSSQCARAVQRAHERIKQCYVAYYETVPSFGIDSDKVASEESSHEKPRLTGRALLREIIRLHPVVYSPSAKSKVKELAVKTAKARSVSPPMVSPSLGDAHVIGCEVDALRLQWIRTHLKQAAYLRFTDLSTLIKRVKAVHRKLERENEEFSETPTKSGLVVPGREFDGITLAEFERVIRVELDVPARMVTKDEICNIFHYVSQGAEGIEYNELLRFLVDEELLKKIHFKLQAATYTLGGSDLENELFKGHNGNGNTVNFPQFVTLFRKVLKLTPQQCSDIDVRTVFEYMGGTYVHGVEKNRFKEFLNEDFNLDFVARRLKARKWHVPSAAELLKSGIHECILFNRKIVKLKSTGKPPSKRRKSVTKAKSTGKSGARRKSSVTSAKSSNGKAETSNTAANENKPTKAKKSNAASKPRRRSKSTSSKTGSRRNSDKKTSSQKTSKSKARSTKSKKSFPEAAVVHEVVLNFFQKYHENKVSEVPGVLKKFHGKEQKLVRTLNRLYGDDAKHFFEAHGLTV